MSSLEQIQALLQRKRLDALLISQPENRRYLSGYSAPDTSIDESAGYLLIPAKRGPILLTDSRYELQAEAEAAEFDVAVYPRGLQALLLKILPSLQIKRLAFESHYTLHATALSLTKALQKIAVEFVSLPKFVEKLRAQKTADEIDKIRLAVNLNEEVFVEIYSGLKPGQTERDVALKIETAMRMKGADGPSFDTIVAAGPNGARPHAIPTNRPLREGEPIIIDMGVRLNGYCSDMTRTVVCGNPDEKTLKLLRLVRKAQLAGMNSIRAGVVARDVDRAARGVIDQAGFGKRFGHGLGHGVGLAVHEAPALNRRNRRKLLSGMVVTVEPGIYIPEWGGVRLENMVAVYENGHELLNNDRTFLDV